MMISYLRYYFVTAFVLLLTSCSGLGTSNTREFNKNNVIGRNIDEVVAEFIVAGLRCSGKGTDKEVFTNRLLGLVNCGNRGATGFCPKSYSLSVNFDLQTNKVIAFGKDERDNCF